ncbi:Papain-like cysteine protease AvrRpt2 [Legionella gratiana]|uniref:Papain-like cysteine protease AvrRpt2 n=1 Tax=Legionella gratiana TaxID=45066 RepID=A0A378JB16_9GAMM|nr:papain-like cysteine protease family protein [Legionella gratiana]KTD15666.1 Papain-like cysteine protease AvrRpt2 [Legionella gratiana]STX44795.1 Transcriptional regulator, IclR family [Legionella gratiana]
MKIAIQLKSEAPNIPWEALDLQVSYFVKTDTEEFLPKTEKYPALGSGDISVKFGNDLVREKDVFFSLLLDSANVLAQNSISAEELNESTPITMEFDYNPRELSQPPAEIVQPKPLFVYGRLLEKNGNKKMDDVQIIFEASKDENTPLIPIASVRTEANGYFFIEYPEGYYKDAVARVGLNIRENPIPIRLKEKLIDGEQHALVFPNHVIIVVELPEAEELEEQTECGCKELDVHENKRVLEEYSFYSLVRTTEPEILGYVLEEDDDISLDEVLTNHPIKIWEILDPIIKLPAFNHLTMRTGFASSEMTIARPGTTPATNPAPNNELLESLKKIKINRSVLNTFLKSVPALTKDNIVHLIELNEALRFKKKIRPVGPKPLGRVILNGSAYVDWDKDATLYQAVSVAHGHLLQFKSEWIADGYSLGDLLYSLPLAPGQKKQIVVFDWERRESASNTQSVEYEESLYNSLGRDRDIYEITKGVIEEKISGKSSATTASASAGIGGFLGGMLFGVSGGVGHSGSTASQNSLRQTSASDLQKIRDRIVQSANAIRSQRSSVIQTVSQGERFEVSSETVANYNHCHAITIQYFEVLRHFKVRQRLADARECLFVPLLMSQFDLDKALRWKESLHPSLINSALSKAFEAAGRVKNKWIDSNFPSGTFASEKIVTASGSFQIKFIIRRPEDKRVEVDDYSKPIYSATGIIGYQKKFVDDINEANWQSLIPFLGADTPKGFYDHHLKDAKNKDEIFHRLLGEKIAMAFVGALTFHVADETGNEISSMAFDTSLTSRYRKESTLNVTVRFMGPSQFSRDKLHYIKIRCGTNNILPDYSSIIIVSGFIRYKTPHYEGFLCRYQSIQDDLSPTDGATLYAGPGSDELRDPRKDDIASVNLLIDHLNDNLEYYHKAIWLRMSPERRFLLLDGIILPGEKGMGRSLASLVENELIGIVGNSLVFPVAQGLNLDPNFGLSDSLFEYYMVSASDPINISVPTKGVYAEAMMGACNSCEEKDESRFWRWEESPIPDSPTAINPIDTESRRSDPGNLQPAPLANPVVNIQNAPNAPDPTGLASTLSLLGKGDSFRDITGLTQNQTNALEALKASYDTTKTFGQEVAKLEMQKMMERRLDNAIKAINSNPNLDQKQKTELTEKALNAYLGAGAKTDTPPKDANSEKLQEGINKNLDKVNKSKSGEVAISKPDGTKINTKFNDDSSSSPTIETKIGKGGITPMKQESPNTCWATVATMMMRWKDGTNYTVEAVLTKAGAQYLNLYNQKQGLPFEEKQNFISSLGMKGEPQATYTAENYRDWLTSHGPLWVTTDADPTKGFSAHARIITGISSDLKNLELIDPSKGTKAVQSFEEFSNTFNELITDSPLMPATQVVHFLDIIANPTEGNDPTPADIVKNLNEYNPASSDTLVINTIEFNTGISGIKNYKDWQTDNTVVHNRRKNAYRDPFGIIQLVLHETAGETGDGFDGSANETSHMSVKRDATVLQFNDLVEFENHGSGMNTTSIGIEFVNRGWLSSTTDDGGEGIPSKESSMTAAQKETYKEANGYLWLFWGYGFNIYRVPPSMDQLEKEVEVVKWLTMDLPTILQGISGISIYNLFPSIDDTWLQLISYDEVKDIWTFKDADIPPEAERTEKNLFVMTTGYEYLTPTEVRSKSGIISHNAFYDNHSDGSFLTLYTWLRLKKGKNKTEAFDISKKLMKNHSIRVSLTSNTDKKIFLVHVKDGNLV